jgi:hypothetical protein
MEKDGNLKRKNSGRKEEGLGQQRIQKTISKKEL